MLYLGISLWIGWARIEEAILRFHHTGTALTAFALIFGGVLLRAIRWQLYADYLDWGVPGAANFTAFMAGFSLTITPGKAGEVVKSALLRTRYSVPVAQSAGAIIVERLTDLAAVLVLAAGGIAVFSGMMAYAAAAGVVVVALALLGQPRLYEPTLRWLQRLRKFKAPLGRLTRLLGTTRTLLRPRPFAVGLGLALMAWGAEAFALKVMAEALLPPLVLTPWMAASVFGLATLAGALAMLPGGIGGFEAVLVLLLVKLGATAPDAAVVALVFRLCTLWLISVIGLIFMALWVTIFVTDPLPLPTASNR